MASKRRSGGLATLGALVERTVYGREAKKKLSRAAWQEIAGVAFGRRTEPLKIARGTLHLKVSSSAWAQEISLAEKTLVERLVARGLEVTKIRCEVGSVALGRAPGVAVTRTPVEPPWGLLRPLAKVADKGLRDTMERVAWAFARLTAREAELSLAAKATAETPHPIVPRSRK